MSYKLGIDIGSTTIKAVVLDEKNEIVYQSYERHKSKVREMTDEKINELATLLKDKNIQIAISGSAGIGIAKEANFPFVQEVFATAQAVKQYFPKTDVVLELGGEDAKIIFFKGALEERMNSTCAGGTGAFIDQMASLLDMSPDDMDKESLHYTELYPIASRCGVFAKSDVQPLMNQGVEKSNLAASIFQAVVDQSIAGLAQGREIDGNVLFLGGPLFFLKGLQNRFKETLNLDDEHATFPEIGPYFVALGTALYAENEHIYTYDEIKKHLQQTLDMPQTYAGLAPLFKDDDEYQAFMTRHAAASVPIVDISTYHGNAYLGIDAGSTTTKIVLTGEQEQILYVKYMSNKGNPIDVVKVELGKLYDSLNEDTHIIHSAVTGYGEQLMKAAFHIDLGIVETIAHYTAAKHFNNDVDFIIDIGGQDMKCFKIKDHAIDNILLNEACSSGCGSFIETFATSLGYTVQDFAKIGLKSNKPVDLGTRCTVFMNSSVKQAQKNGAKVEDISAGLAISVVKNALYKVIRAKDVDELGKHIIVQGGTFLNDTILRSFELELGRQVIRPNIAHLMGAYGASLIAKEQATTSHLITKEQLQDFYHTSQAFRCNLCTNHCNLTVNTFNDNQKHIAGNKCSKPLKKLKSTKSLPNLFQFKYDYLTNLKSVQGERGQIGIPLTLNMYELLPFWHTLFTKLRFEVVVSGPSNKQLYALGQHTIPSDTACYPAKLVHGHIQSLINKGVKRIFYPCLTYNLDEQISDNHFNCPVVAYYPELIDANMKLDTVDFIDPYLYLNDLSVFEKGLYEAFAKHHTYFTEDEFKLAVDAAYQAHSQFRKAVQEEGAKAIAFAKEHHKNTIVLAGRPYHIDPQIHHGIPNLLNDLGFVVVSEDALPLDDKKSYHVLNQWTYHARMYNAAHFVAKHSHMELLQLVSFGCGIDAITSDEVCDILEENHKLYTQLKIDEIDNLGAITIRCRSLLAAMEERNR